MDGVTRRAVPGFEAYEVTDDGRVWSTHKLGWLRQCTMKRGGYVAVSLWRDGHGSLFTVHKLVMLAFVGPRPRGMDIAHRDGDKRNNTLSNLRYATRQENEGDKVLHGRSNRGERNGMAKISDADAVAVRDAVGANPPRGRYRRVAERFGLSESAVWNIANGKRRLHETT